MCGVSAHASRLLFSQPGLRCRRGVSKFKHVSCQPCSVDITPAQRCGRPTAWTKAGMVATLMHRSPFYGWSTTTTGARGAVLSLANASFGACGSSRKTFPTENRSTTARDTHCGSTNFFPEADSQASPDQHPLSSHPFPLRSLTRQDDRRRAPSPGASKAFFVHSHQAAHRQASSNSLDQCGTGGGGGPRP
jgi:hypothetical protein